MNTALAGLLLEGAAGRLAAVGLGDLVYHNLGVPLGATAIESKLGEYGLRRAHLLSVTTVTERVTSITAGWLAGIERELLQPTIPRTAADELFNVLSGEDQLVLLSGNAGDGKSAVLHQVVRRLETDSVVVLGFRLDRLEPFSSTTALGHRLDLQASPVTALAAIAGERSAVLIIDQLDAVSLASGRMPRSFDAIANVIREASAFPNMRVLLACRNFDIDNDHRIRELVKNERTAQIKVEKLSELQVSNAVREMGLDPAVLTTQQMALRRSPLHLVLLNSVADEAVALSFRTIENLFDSFWERKLVDCTQHRNGTVRFTEVVHTLANAISTRQRLSVHISVLDQGDLTLDAGVLVSEHVLTRDGQQVTFFHEAFFDYAFARAWTNRNQTIVEFLLADEQELFLRAQVRQILNHLRDAEPQRFVTEVEYLLTNTAIRFHVKEVVLGILRSLPDPTSAEWEMISGLLESHPTFEARIWLTLRTLPWFERVDADGVIGEWLASDDKQFHERAISMMIGGVKERPNRMAEVLQPHAGRTEKYSEWLLLMVRLSNVHESRPLFKLLLDALQSGEIGSYGHNLWISVYELAKHQPVWTVELLAAHLILRADALAMDAGKVTALLDCDHTVMKLVSEAAEGAPREFCETLIPYMLTVMRLTEAEFKNHLLGDAHFSMRIPHDTFHELEDALLFSAANALRHFATLDPEAARPLFASLAADKHDAAQWLLYEGLKGDAAGHYADWVASLLLEDRKRFLSGYMSNGVWTTRELIQSITPHVSNEAFSKLEEAIVALHFPWERRRPRWYVFNLLSAMEETRLSTAGRRQLGELRRFIGVEQPEAPEPIEFRQVLSPISPEAAQHMTDDDWLRAMLKHKADREDFGTFKGGSHELSQV